MRRTAQLLACMLLVACAAQDQAEQKSTQDTGQAIEDLIQVRGLQQVKEIATASFDKWTVLDERFLLYKGRRDTHLIEFGHPCREFDSNKHVIADRRWDASRMQARFDTFRGCRIKSFYTLTEHEIAELESIGEAVGSRN